MDLEKVLQEYGSSERSSTTVVYFYKNIDWFCCDNFLTVVNRLPEDVLVEWLKHFILNLCSGVKMPCRIYGNTPIGKVVLPFQFVILPHSIHVSYLNTHWRGGVGSTLFLIIDGTEAGIKKFEQALVKDNLETLGIYSPDVGVFVTKVP